MATALRTDSSDLLSLSPSPSYPALLLDTVHPVTLWDTAEIVCDPGHVNALVRYRFNGRVSWVYACWRSPYAWPTVLDAFDWLQGFGWKGPVLVIVEDIPF